MPHQRDRVPVVHAQAGLRRTYHKMSPKHSHRYVREVVGRQNIREMDTLAQMAFIAKGLDHKVLHYRDLIAD